MLARQVVADAGTVVSLPLMKRPLRNVVACHLATYFTDIYGRERHFHMREPIGRQGVFVPNDMLRCVQLHMWVAGLFRPVIE